MNEDFVKLVIARLETMPDNMKVNLGSVGTLQKSDLIQHVKSGDSLGQKIMEIQIKYLRALKDL